MKKRLQLRGISRSPSDRMTSDGGCAESLNVHLVDSETAPVLAPEDITDMYGPNAAKGLAGPALYIHKGLSYNNLVFLDNPSRTVMAYKKGGTGKEAAMKLYTLQSGEEINTITSVGNTVVICTNQRMEYVLFKDGAYKDLGDRIPVPMVEFRTQQWDATGWRAGYVGAGYRSEVLLDSFNPNRTSRIQVLGSSDRPKYSTRRGVRADSSDPVVAKDIYDGIKGWSMGTWSDYLNGGRNTLTYRDSYNEVCNAVWDLLTMQAATVKRQGYFCTPVFARYALRLYDGSYIYQSVPVLLGAGDREYFKAQGRVEYNQLTSTAKSYLDVCLRSYYTVKAYLMPYSYDGWEDIVESVDLFLSTDIHYPLLNSKILGLTENGDESVDGEKLIYDLSFSDDEEDVEEERRRNEILSKSVFYRIETFGSERMGKLAEGYNLMLRDEFISQDYLVTQPTLPDDYMSHHRKMAEDVFQYNNKVILTGVASEITSGYQYLNGTCVRDEYTEEQKKKRTYRFHFYMRDSANSELNVYARNPEEGKGFVPYALPLPKPIYRNGVLTGVADDGSVGQYNYAQVYCWLAYPDSRCYRVDVTVTAGEGDGGETTTRRYDMEPHPLLNLSYVLLEIDGRIGFDGGSIPRSGDVTRSASPGSAGANVNRETEEVREYRETNVIWASEIDNPFVFPASGRLTFVSEVIALANATRALSEGQFGHFPIYVFTKDGIWSVPISDEGNFAASVPMSRDVALAKDTIQAIEQAIVFATDQGVMLLQGSGIECISPNMEGDHYTNPSDLVELLSNDDNLGALQAAYYGDAPFKSFLRGLCKVAFDYAGRRILFFTQLYAYVYRLRTQTWHKLSLDGEGVIMMNALNSYPDCYLCCRKTKDGRYYLYDFSIEYASDPTTVQRTLPGLVITRPFDLDLPDVRKTITGIRVRGNYNRNDVKYILLGSMDGIHWGILPTLRGGSYKLFRLALVIDMEAGERITWVDVEFEQRLDNRMR